MWPFDPPKPETPPPPPEADELSESDHERLGRLEREFLQLQTEWADTLDKIGRHFARAAARDRQRLHRDLSSLETPEDAPGPTNGESQGSGQASDAKARLRAAVNAQRLRRA